MTAKLAHIKEGATRSSGHFYLILSKIRNILLLLSCTVLVLYLMSILSSHKRRSCFCTVGIEFIKETVLCVIQTKNLGDNFRFLILSDVRLVV